MAIMRMFIAKKRSPGSINVEARKGFVPVMVGGDQDGFWERFMIPTHFISHPSIVSLLESSANEFGYTQQGVLHIPHHPDSFREILRSLTRDNEKVFLEEEEDGILSLAMYSPNCKPIKGYVPVMVGDHIDKRERFLVPTNLISHPAIVSLLESSANEFEYSQQGVIQITQDPNSFREILRRLTMSNKILAHGIRPNREDFVFFGGYLCM